MNKLRLIVVVLLVAFSCLCILDSRHAWDWIYTHWLYDYHFGFMKRGLVGELLRIAFASQTIVPLEIVKVFSWIIFLLNATLFLYFFDQIRRLTKTYNERLHLVGFFAFCLLAPTFIRNFAYDLGRFDQISCLLFLAQWFNPALWLTALLSIPMILIHENYIFIFLPAILLLVYLQRGLWPTVLVATTSLLTLIFVLKFGGADTDIDTLWRYLLSKANSPLDHNVELLYWNLSDQLAVNRKIHSQHIQYLPGFFFYLLWCVPLVIWLWSARPRRDLYEKSLTVGIAVGYIGIFVLSDWCRSIANLFVVLVFLLLYFLKSDNHFRDSFLQKRVLKSPMLYIVAIFSIVIPAAGVDIPRLYKLWEIIVNHI
jgi:hypothetical protein